MSGRNGPFRAVGVLLLLIATSFTVLALFVGLDALYIILAQLSFGAWILSFAAVPIAIFVGALWVWRRSDLRNN